MCCCPGHPDCETSGLSHSPEFPCLLLSCTFKNKNPSTQVQSSLPSRVSFLLSVVSVNYGHWAAAMGSSGSLGTALYQAGSTMCVLSSRVTALSLSVSHYPPSPYPCLWLAETSRGPSAACPHPFLTRNRRAHSSGGPSIAPENSLPPPMWDLKIKLRLRVPCHCLLGS